MKIEILKDYLNLPKGVIVDKEDFIAKKLIRFGVAKLSGEKELKEIEVPTPLVEETKEFKPKNKKTK